MNKKNHPDPATLLARAGGYVDAGSGGVVPPMQPSTTYVRDKEYELMFPQNSYGRDQNDQVRLAESIICQMEGGAESLLFASGMAAISTVLGSLRAGQKLLIQNEIYWGTTAWVRKSCEHHGVVLIEANSAQTADFCRLIADEKPDLIFIETPSNPWLRVSDINSISNSSQSVGSILVVDATAATPVLSQPLLMGADIVMHSATKAINGHSDVIAGILTCKSADAAIWEHIKAVRHGAGAILSPNAAWLLIRGMRTLPLRIERMCSNAMAIARYLENHEKIEAVWYPGLSSFEGHELAAQQMTGGFGYLMSFLVRGDKSDALRFCGELQGIHRATSLGGVESLVEHRHTIEGDVTACPENLIRLSVGIESANDLIAELDNALQCI